MFENGVEKARAALGKLTAARGELEGKATAAAAELVQLRADAGERELAEILEGADAGPGRARIVELDARINGLSAARSALLARIGAAQKALAHEQAEVIRGAAQKAQAVLEKHLRSEERRVGK